MDTGIDQLARLGGKNDLLNPLSGWGLRQLQANQLYVFCTTKVACLQCDVAILIQKLEYVQSRKVAIAWPL